MIFPTIVVLVLLQGAWGQRNRNPACEQSSCYPATGDLLIGRSSDKFLKSSSSCGLDQRERYCIVSHLEDYKSCFVCDSRQPYIQGLNQMSHRIENIVSTFSTNRYRRKWWQAENGKQFVSIQLDLEAEFHFTHLIMTFKTFRPAAMLVERSYDFGKTWKIYRYFAYDCEDSFPGVPLAPIRNINDVICENRYSDVAPSSRGEVIFRVLPPSIEIEDPYSEEVQDLLKMTNLRVNFTKLHTLGDNLLDSRDEIKEKYYYALYNMVVRGSCSCYGHASRCVPIAGSEDNPNMVHGQCECTHNTKGLNCEQCDDFYNDLPWRPARGRETNACKKCDCNNHALRCHFDPAVYEATGRVSGGVCDECQHNTMGRNCEECKPFFYQDSGRDITDPYVCVQCDCDPIGSEHGGECESRTDDFNSLVAGRCICKPLVEGRRCDTCKDGYWNLEQDNPDGCEACSCSTVGTVGNYGCDKRTGECRCKRYVSGRMCDQCLPGYWGLDDSPEGCKPCDCDVGGAYDNICDSQTGQCTCKAHIIGRQCNQPEPGFFSVDLDFLRYEGEFARGIGNTSVVIRDIAGRPVTWTGPGFMRVSEGDKLEFTVDDIPMSLEYDLVIRYEHDARFPDSWYDVRVTVIRPGPVDQRGVCANSIPQDDDKAANLPRVSPNDERYGYEDYGSGMLEVVTFDRGDIPSEAPSDYQVYYDNNGKLIETWQLRDTLKRTGQGYVTVSPASCLETGVGYTIRLDFNSYRGDRRTPGANILIDSIMLVPSINSIPIFIGSDIANRMREEFIRYRCMDEQLSVMKQEPSEVCKKYLFSISAIIRERAMDCQCDPTGSYSGVCNPQGGQCECKPNVIGRRCDQCAPGTYGFDPQGCRSCDCNEYGSRDNYCDVTSGNCVCRDPEIRGRQCNMCQSGYYGFPYCQPCRCNGRADECDDNGICIDCKYSSGGDNCERCERGYYGDPNDPLLGCRACMCPGGAGSGYQHGETCNWDRYTNRVSCNCEPGYAGDRCDQCAQNHFGNPLVPGGTCESCTCNNNIDPDVPGSCDPATGECLKCLFHSEGFSCESCIPGYYGEATQQNCQACVCNILGTDRTNGGVCDGDTGQCPCLPNVIGQRCDRCVENHWKIASGLGCESCNCDPVGSVSARCNEFDGQCECIPGRGGRDCSDCPDLTWGDPQYQCFPCECNPDGSETLQCDRQTGQCPCLEGITGDRCDRCDRGTTGQLPNCMPCGECFDNWDQIINDLKEQTDILVKEGSDIKVTGAPGAFDKEFKEMEEKLDDVRKIVLGTNVTTEDLDALRQKMAEIRANLTANTDDLDEVNDELKDTANRIEIANNKIESLKNKVDDLKQAAQDLRDSATDVKELDVAGAFNSTKESLRRSNEAQAKVDATGGILVESERTRQQAEDLIRDRQAEFDRKMQDNDDDLTDLEIEMDKLDDSIVDLNEMVCDGRGDPCDGPCGGAGCGKCGGLSCDDGAVTKADNAKDFAERADEVLQEKYKKAQNLLQEMQTVEGDTNMAKVEAKEAFDRAEQAKNESESSRAMLEDLLDRISEFLQRDEARPSDIRMIAEMVLDMSISLTPEQIKDLADQISETIKGLTDIDAILEDTKDNLELANGLKERADNAKKDAEDILGKAERVNDALQEARDAQDDASFAIDQATDDIKGAEDDLTQIESETDDAKDKSNQTLRMVEDLKERLDALKNKYFENEINVEKAENEANTAEDLADKAAEDATDLESKYNDASSQLEIKYNETAIAKKRADSLRDRASKLYLDTKEKIEKLQYMQVEFDKNEKGLLDLSSEIDELNKQMLAYLTSIQEVAKYHRTCSGN